MSVNHHGHTHHLDGQGFPLVRQATGSHLKDGVALWTTFWITIEGLELILVSRLAHDDELNDDTS